MGAKLFNAFVFVYVYFVFIFTSNQVTAVNNNGDHKNGVMKVDMAIKNESSSLSLDSDPRRSLLSFPRIQIPKSIGDKFSKALGYYTKKEGRKFSDYFMDYLTNACFPSVPACNCYCNNGCNRICCLNNPKKLVLELSKCKTGYYCCKRNRITNKCDKYCCS